MKKQERQPHPEIKTIPLFLYSILVLVVELWDISSKARNGRRKERLSWHRVSKQVFTVFFGVESELH